MSRQAEASSFRSISVSLYGERARAHGDLERAQALYDESLAMTQTDQDLLMMTANLGRQGRLAALKGDYWKAQRFYFKLGPRGVFIADRPDCSPQLFLISK